jgi:hypothetical protein
MSPLIQGAETVVREEGLLLLFFFFDMEVGVVAGT